MKNLSLTEKILVCAAIAIFCTSSLTSISLAVMGAGIEVMRYWLGGVLVGFIGILLFIIYYNLKEDVNKLFIILLLSITGVTVNAQQGDVTMLTLVDGDRVELPTLTPKQKVNVFVDSIKPTEIKNNDVCGYRFEQTGVFVSYNKKDKEYILEISPKEGENIFFDFKRITDLRKVVKEHLNLTYVSQRI